MSEVTGSTATVQLLLDPTTGVTAEVLGEQGALGTIVPATGTPGELNMLQVPKAVRVRTNDTVITTGSGGRLNSMYPDGLAIGRVSQATPVDEQPEHADPGHAVRRLHQPGRRHRPGDAPLVAALDY